MGIANRTVVGGEKVALYNLMAPSYVHTNVCRARNFAAYTNVFMRGRDVHRIADIADAVKGTKPNATVVEVGAGTAFVARNQQLNVVKGRPE